MKKQQRKLVLNKKTVSVLQAKEMAIIRGGAVTIPNQDKGPFTMTSDSDSFVACGSCFGDCPTNSRAGCDDPFTVPMTIQM